MTSTPPPAATSANANATAATPSNPPPNPPAQNASASTPAPPSSAHKRRPYEDPTDGERYQLYVHSREHPELKQKDLVTWFAQSFGKEINQSTVSRALKRYRDNPPENPEVAGAAKSKRGGGAGANAASSSPAAGGASNKRRKTGGSVTLTGTVVVPGANEVEEEAASEQVQRENQQGRANGTGKDTAQQRDNETPTVHVIPYNHSVPPLQPRGRGAAAAQQAQHHHHSLPQQQQQLQHVLPHTPIAPHHGPPIQGAPQAPMAGAFPPSHIPNNHVPHINNHVNHQAYQPAAGAPQLDIDSDSDSDVEGNTMTNGNGTYADAPDSSFTSDDVELAALHRRYESILLRSVLASGGAPGVTLPAEIPQLGDGASTDGPSAEGGETGSVPNHPTLSRESLVMYVVGRNELVRSLQGRVTGMEREVSRLRRKLQRRDELIRRLQGGQGQA